MNPQEVRHTILGLIDRLQGNSASYVGDKAIAEELNLPVEEVQGHLGILKDEDRIDLVKVFTGWSACLNVKQRQRLKEETESQQARGNLADVTTPQQVVLLIHGIRTQADWQEMVAQKLDQEGNLKVIPIRYDYFDGFKFWFPFFTRTGPIKRVLKEIRVVNDQHPGAKLSIIAHSFGTYIIGSILQQEFDIKIHRLVMCGSVLPRDFHWERLLRQLEQDHVVNECGKKDIWPVLAQCSTWGYGASGTHGFGAVFVKDRFHDATHSQYFDPDFVDRYWVPFFQKGEYKQTPFEVSRPTSPWWIAVLRTVPLQNLLCVTMLVLALLFGVSSLKDFLHSQKDVPKQIETPPPKGEKETNAQPPVSVETRFVQRLNDLALLDGKKANIGLFVGGPLSDDSIAQLDHLTTVAKTREVRLVAVSPYRYDDLIRKSMPSHRRIALQTGPAFFERNHDVDIVLFLGFENISGVIPNPLGGDDKAISAKEYLDLCTVMTAQSGKNGYVFGGPDSWVPTDTVKLVFIRYNRTIWHGNRTGDDLGAFFDKCLAPWASGPIGPPKPKTSSKKQP